LQGSETFKDASSRAIDKLNRIINENLGRSILIVTHTVVVKMIMAYFEDRPLKKPHHESDHDGVRP